jgi:hypothetical protein
MTPLYQNQTETEVAPPRWRRAQPREDVAGEDASAIAKHLRCAWHASSWNRRGLSLYR